MKSLTWMLILNAALIALFTYLQLGPLGFWRKMISLTGEISWPWVLANLFILDLVALSLFLTVATQINAKHDEILRGDTPPVAPTGGGQQKASDERGRKSPWPPVRVKLRDQSVCELDVNLQFQVLPEDAPRVVASIGNIDAVAEYLKPMVEAALIARLSKLTYPELADSLASMAADVTNDVAARARPAGVTVHAVYITKVSRVTSNDVR